MTGERPQIAADIGDTLIRRLYTVGIALHRSLSLVGSDEARAEIESALADLNETIRIIELGAADISLPDKE